MTNQSQMDYGTARQWMERLNTPVGHQVELPDDLLQMTMSPLGGSDPSEWSLGELLHHACPPIPWLKGIARFGQEVVKAGDLSSEIATALFHAAVASALVKRNTRIVRSSDELLQRGLTRCLGYDWLDKDTHHLMEQARSHLNHAGDWEAAD